MKAPFTEERARRHRSKPQGRASHHIRPGNSPTSIATGNSGAAIELDDICAIGDEVRRRDGLTAHERIEELRARQQAIPPHSTGHLNEGRSNDPGYTVKD